MGLWSCNDDRRKVQLKKVKSHVDILRGKMAEVIMIKASCAHDGQVSFSDSNFGSG